MIGNAQNDLEFGNFNFWYGKAWLAITILNR